MITKPYKYVGAVGVWALEVLSFNHCFLVVRAFDRTKLWGDLFDNGSVIVQIAVALFRWNNLLPLLLVEGKHQDSLGTSWGLRCENSEEIVVDLIDSLDSSNNLPRLSILKLCI